jgi:hypothetical protein
MYIPFCRTGLFTLHCIVLQCLSFLMMFAIQGRLHRNCSPPKPLAITRFTSTQIPTNPAAVSTSTSTITITPTAPTAPTIITSNEDLM